MSAAATAAAVSAGRRMCLCCMVFGFMWGSRRCAAEVDDENLLDPCQPPARYDDYTAGDWCREAGVNGGEESAVVLAFATPTSRDKDAVVEALFREHFGSMVRLAYCLLGDRSAAEDVAQEAFVALHLHWGTLRDRGALLPYVRSVVFNQCRSRQRWLIRGRRAMSDLGSPDPVPSSEDSAVLLDETHRLSRAIRDLPRRQREVIVCRFLLGLSEAETSAELDMSVGSVKQHTHRARAALQAAMGAGR